MDLIAEIRRRRLVSKESISSTAREPMIGYRKMAIEPDAIGRAIQYAIEQLGDVDVNEIVVRPLAARSDHNRWRPILASMAQPPSSSATG